MLFQIETREDEEQNVKLEETIELLRSAGYFRARIKGLSPFDKVAILIRNVLFNGIKYFFSIFKELTLLEYLLKRISTSWIIVIG